MICIDNWIITDNPPVRMIMQVHDELIFEVDNSFIVTAGQKIKSFMEQVISLKAPLVSNISFGNSWGSLN